MLSGRLGHALVLVTLVTLFLLLSAFSAPVPCYATDYYWIGGTGSWDDPANWSPYGVPGQGPPPHVDNAYILTSDATDKTVSIDWANLASLTLDATGGGTSTLSILPGSSLTLLRSYAGTPPFFASVGVNGTATVDQTGGVFFPYEGWLSLGINPGSIGTYNLSGGTLTGSDALNINIGVGGAGIFNQTGGTVFVDGWITLGAQDGSLGVYNLSDGVVGYDHNNVIVGGDGVGIFNQSGGSVDAVSLSVGVHGTYNQTGGQVTMYQGHTFNNLGTYNLSGGTLTTRDISNSGTLNYSGGNLLAYYPTDTLINNGTTNLSGDGVRTVNHNVINNGTVKTTHTTAVYTGTFTNNGAYISDPATQSFNELIVGESGYLVAQRGDQFFISGDFINNSTMRYDWNTMQAYLAFIDGVDNTHVFSLAGLDLGATMSGYANNFSWGTLDVSGQLINFYDGNADPGAAFYLRDLLGVQIGADLIIANLFGFDGLTLYYMANLPDNAYLGGFTYNLEGGGQLRPIGGVPEPSTILLVGTGFVGLVAFRRKFRA